MIGTHSLDAIQRELLLEACRAKDRLDRMHAVADPPNSVIRETGRTALLLMDLMNALRLPDANGRQP